MNEFERINFIDMNADKAVHARRMSSEEMSQKTALRNRLAIRVFRNKQRSKCNIFFKRSKSHVNCLNAARLKIKNKNDCNWLVFPNYNYKYITISF